MTLSPRAVSFLPAQLREGFSRVPTASCTASHGHTLRNIPWLSGSVLAASPLGTPGSRLVPVASSLGDDSSWQKCLRCTVALTCQDASNRRDGLNKLGCNCRWNALQTLNVAPETRERAGESLVMLVRSSGLGDVLGCVAAVFNKQKPQLRVCAHLGSHGAKDRKDGHQTFPCGYSFVVGTQARSVFPFVLSWV